LAVAEMLDETVERLRVADLDAEGVIDRRRNELRIRDRVEGNEEHAVPELVEHLCPELQGQPRLAGAARARQREESRPGQQPSRGFDLGATDEGGRLDRQVVRACLERTQGRERAREARNHRLEEALGM